MKLQISIIILLIITFQSFSFIKADTQDFVYKVNKEDTKKYKFVHKINDSFQIDIIEIFIESVSENSISFDYTGYPPNSILDKSCFDNINNSTLDYAICHFGWFDFYIGNDTYTSIPIIGTIITKTTDINGWENFIENKTDYLIENPYVTEERSFKGENLNYNYTRRFFIETGWLVYQQYAEYFESVNTAIFYSFEDITEETNPISTTDISTSVTSNGFGISVFLTTIGSLMLIEKNFLSRKKKS